MKDIHLKKFTFIIIAVGGLLLFIFSITLNEEILGVPRNEIFLDSIIGVMISILSGIFATIVWHTFTKEEKRDDDEKLIKRIHQQFEGLKEIDLNDAYEKAQNYIDVASEVRIIGMPDTAKDAVNSYLNRTVQTLGKNDKLKYRRICPLVMNNDFFEHLKRVLELNPDKARKDKDFQSEILLLDDFI